MASTDGLVPRVIVDRNNKTTTVWVKPEESQQLDATLVAYGVPSAALRRNRVERIAETKRDIRGIGHPDHLVSGLAALGYEHPEDREGTRESRTEMLTQLFEEIQQEELGVAERIATTDEGAQDLADYLDEAGYERRGLGSDEGYYTEHLGAPSFDRNRYLTFTRPDGTQTVYFTPARRAFELAPLSLGSRNFAEEIVASIWGPNSWEQ